MTQPQNRRILLIDDLPSIHEDFRKILWGANAASELDDDEAALFGTAAPISAITFELDSAYQGQEAMLKVSTSLEHGLPYAMAFVDMRMPPGWNGVETIKHLWQADPRLQIVICTAYSDYSWEEILSQLDVCDRLLILKKPFDNIEVFQLANALTTKWAMTQQAESHMDRLEEQVAARTLELKTANDALLQQIVERKLIEQALRLKDQAIEAAINAIFLTNNSLPDNPIEYVNPAFERMTGYTQAEVMGKNMRFLLGQDQDQPGMQVIQEAMQNAGEGRAVLRNYRKDGTPFWSECHIAGVHDDVATAAHFVVVLNDITEAKQLEQQLQHRANYDALTALPTRTLFMDRLLPAIAIAERQQRPMAVAFFDLDRFKWINDTLGHDAGDSLLQEIAMRLSECVRTSDTVARIGGDEFVILLHPDTTDSDPATVMQRIVERVAQPITLRGEQHSVTCSIGVSVFPQDGHDADTLLKHADVAMYQAKKLGRNNYQFYGEETANKVGTGVAQVVGENA
ncbi:diguanylate cyclase domain-containing protein [Glaciimonas sp. GG7]